MHSLEWKCLYLYQNFTEVCSLGSNWQWSSIGLDNGLVPNRRQAIIWTNADQIDWRIYVALGGDELMHWPPNCYQWCQGPKGCEFASHIWQHKLVCKITVYITMRLSYLYHGNSYTGKTTSLDWDRPRASVIPDVTYLLNDSIWYVPGITHMISVVYWCDTN